ncbi:hypothetical protein FRC07_005485 [Ceratobasidium sp. 392]|nr:hypothetical protein FRC07_005485 [Ceratobasidium sp. 392]
MEYHYMPYLGPIPTRPPAPAWDYVEYQPQTMYNLDYYLPTYQYPYIAYTHALPPPPPTPLPRNRADTAPARDIIGWALDELDVQVKNFKFPVRLDFSEPSNDGRVPRLSETRRNRPLNDHRSSLEYLLDVLKGVRSHGDEVIKAARANAIERVQSELARLTLKKEEAWRNKDHVLTAPSGTSNCDEMRGHCGVGDLVVLV